LVISPPEGGSNYKLARLPNYKILDLAVCLRGLRGGACGVVWRPCSVLTHWKLGGGGKKINKGGYRNGGFAAD
jgi:hypothetical protein